MGQKDLAQNDYFSNPERFADICNGILFHGENVIWAEDLQETDADIVYQENKGRLRKIIPDKVRLWKGTYLSLITLENQSMVDYGMVFRTMKETALSYEKQWKQREEEHSRKWTLTPKSGLCWVGKGEVFIPVITIVVYFGTDKEWDGATCLYDMLDISKELEPYVTNYKMNLFDYHNYEDFSIFKTENRELFEVLSCADSKTKMRELFDKNKDRFQFITRETLEIICKIAGIKQQISKKNESEVTDMCKAWDDWHEEGIVKGIAEGTVNGIADSIKKIMENLQFSATKAMEILEIPETEYDKYLNMIN